MYSSATGIQDSSMTGYISDSNFRRETTIFSSSSQKGENYSDYIGSVVEGYVNSYMNYLNDFGISVVEARLISNSDLEKLGCFASQKSCTSSIYSWVYSTSYWTGTSEVTSSI